MSSSLLKASIQASGSAVGSPAQGKVPANMRSPAKTTRSSGTWTMDEQSVWPGRWVISTGPTAYLSSKVSVGRTILRPSKR